MWIINVFYCLHFGAADSRNCETNWLVMMMMVSKSKKENGLNVMYEHCLYCGTTGFFLALGVC